MLRILVRITAVAVALFSSVLAVLYLSVEEDAFPAGATAALSVDVTEVRLDRAGIIEGLSSVADSTSAQIFRVTADPDDFYFGRSLYEFGRSAPEQPRDIDWVTPGRQGELSSASTLGTTSLSGAYAIRGDTSQVSEITDWLRGVGAEVTVNTRTEAAVLRYALVVTGAWLPLMATVLLAVCASVTWFVLRSRARALKMLAGSRTAAVLGEDLVSLGRDFVLYAVAGTLAAMLALTVVGLGAQLVRILTVHAVLLGLLMLGTAAVALLVGIVSWPSLRTLAARTPPERHFRLLAEGLKVAGVIAIALMVPLAAGSVARAAEQASLGQQWSKLNDEVALRAGAPQSEFEARLSDMGAVARAADDADALTLAYTFVPRASDPIAGAGYDALMVVNDRYLEMMDIAIGEPIRAQSLPAPWAAFLTASNPIWTTDGTVDDNFTLYAADDSLTPALLPGDGQMRSLTAPLIAVVTDPGSTLNDSFFASNMSTNTVTFAASWLPGYLETAPVRDIVLSVDRVSDSGLAEAQRQFQVAATQASSLVLAALGLVMTVIVSSWIYVTARLRSIFVARTTGISWARILRARMLWESTIAAILLTVVAATAPRWWPLAVTGAGLYLALSYWSHARTARAGFTRAIARQE